MDDTSEGSVVRGYAEVKAQRDHYREMFSKVLKHLDTVNSHLDVSHAKVLAQREEIRILNGVIARRKRSLRRLRDYVDAVKRLHRPVALGAETVCYECCTFDGESAEHDHTDTGSCWPCRTLRALMLTDIDDSDKVIEIPIIEVVS